MSGKLKKKRIKEKRLLKKAQAKGKKKVKRSVTYRPMLGPPSRFYEDWTTWNRRRRVASIDEVVGSTTHETIGNADLDWTDLNIVVKEDESLSRRRKQKSLISGLLSRVGS